GRKCHICRQPIIGKKWALDHVTALINGGENRETNLAPVHIACHAEKTAKDVAEKARIAAKRRKHIGIVDAPKMQGRPFPKTTKSSRREKVAANKLPVPRPRALFADKEARLILREAMGIAKAFHTAPLWPASRNLEVREGSE